jgi:hypothetical protein
MAGGKTMAVKKEDAEALANECAQLTTGLPMGDPLPERVSIFSAWQAPPIMTL